MRDPLVVRRDRTRWNTGALAEVELSAVSCVRDRSISRSKRTRSVRSEERPFGGRVARIVWWKSSLA
jgi:hypothetical protein